jgi:hypothetical protein
LFCDIFASYLVAPWECYDTLVHATMSRHRTTEKSRASSAPCQTSGPTPTALDASNCGSGVDVQVQLSGCATIARILPPRELASPPTSHPYFFLHHDVPMLLRRRIAPRWSTTRSGAVHVACGSVLVGCGMALVGDDGLPLLLWMAHLSLGPTWYSRCTLQRVPSRVLFFW